MQSTPMGYDRLKQTVWQANQDIVEAGLVELTWGNASGVDREAEDGDGVLVIKPSGVDYDAMAPADLPVVSLKTGECIEGELKPSSDTPTHRHLYRQFEGLGGIVHTHSHYAVVWAQAGRAVPCLGTTHADHFYGDVPVTRPMREDEIRSDYERNTGAVIVEQFREKGLDPEEIPGALVHGHGPFAWGADVGHAGENAIVLESVARKALHTRQLRPDAAPIDPVLLDKHYLRKHGTDAYYGQNG
jgi:L-ribulose-5-phosphate 4-epimerase